MYFVLLFFCFFPFWNSYFLFFNKCHGFCYWTLNDFYCNFPTGTSLKPYAVYFLPEISQISLHISFHISRVVGLICCVSASVTHLIFYSFGLINWYHQYGVPNVMWNVQVVQVPMHCSMKEIKRNNLTLAQTNKFKL